jgi:hypothetical protein
MACWRCAGEGSQYPGPPKAAGQFHRASVLWNLHQLRQVMERDGRGNVAVYLSALIRDFEQMTEDTSPGGDS